MRNLMFSVIALSLLWFLPNILGIIIDDDFGDCDYEQKILPGRIYYIFNPNYSGSYQPGTKCRWTAKSDDLITMNCTISLPESPNCKEAVFKIKNDSSSDLRYCGTGSFKINSKKNFIITFISLPTSKSGKFICDIVNTVKANKNCQCGMKYPQNGVQARMYGGRETGVNEYPMMAAIVSVDTDSDTPPDTAHILCGAIIINPNQVISAAHCVPFINEHQNTRVVVGEHDLKTKIETDVTQFFRIGSFEIHESYDRSSIDYDIVLINLIGTIQFNEKVGAVCLPFMNFQRDYVNKSVELLGWGRLGPIEHLSDSLKKIDVNITSQEKCANHYQNGLTKIGTRQICTSGEEKDSCPSDSGGPVLWHNPQTNRIILIGIISYGKLCASGAPSVNTRVSFHINWIESKIPRNWQYCLVE